MQKDVDGHRQFQLFSRPVSRCCWDFQIFLCFFVLSSPLGEFPFHILKSKRSVLQKWNKKIERDFHVTRIISLVRWGRTLLSFLGICVHFADSGELNLPVWPVPTLPCSVSLLNRTWGVNQMEELMGQDKNREVTHQLPSQENQIWRLNDSVNSFPVNSRMR